ncbi:MAG: hypothetical protein KF732_00210 [Flavobacteriales bacterium]|nr:hypothetical protein [Flavobacteriales bacterium]MBX2958354.1 hypothetical protein [Flavobacteriales bacterium]HRN42832.1 hypothetical protein [Vicingus sp.]HRP58790.1 hypothetical protein [Vicingus sp.]
MPFNSHNIDVFEIKPRFKLISQLPTEEIFNRIRQALPQQQNVEGEVKGTHVFLSINKNKIHYWSPYMEVVIEQQVDDASKSFVRCLIGPKQSVWVMLMLMYIAIGVTSFFGGMYGFAKMNLGITSSFLWFIPAGILLFFVVYFTSKYGQKKGRDQMLYLVSFLYHAIDDDNIERL